MGWDQCQAKCELWEDCAAFSYRNHTNPPPGGRPGECWFGFNPNCYVKGCKTTNDPNKLCYTKSTGFMHGFKNALVPGGPWTSVKYGDF